MRATDIRKSDIGAQAAWKGFTSQTLYIANRLISDNDGYEFCGVFNTGLTTCDIN